MKWRRLIEAQGRGGKSVRAFCRGRGACLPALRAFNKTENRNMRMGIAGDPGLALACGYGLRPELLTVVPDGTREASSLS
jgi:hypothetical protein